jgi:hypothetical protein
VVPPKTMADTPENYDGRPRWVKHQRNSWHGVDFPYHSDLDVADYYRRYCETLLAVDDSVGRVVDTLRRRRGDAWPLCQAPASTTWSRPPKRGAALPRRREPPGLARGGTREGVLNVLEDWSPPAPDGRVCHRIPNNDDATN